MIQVGQKRRWIDERFSDSPFTILIRDSICWLVRYEDGVETSHVGYVID